MEMIMSVLDEVPLKEDVVLALIRYVLLYDALLQRLEKNF